MKNISKITVLLILFITSACTDNCVEGKKASPPGFFVNLVASGTGENLFENDTFTEAHLEITDQLGNPITYNFVEDSNILQVFPNYDKNFRTSIIVLKLNNPDTFEERELQINIIYTLDTFECFSNYAIKDIEFVNKVNQFENLIYTVEL